MEHCANLAIVGAGILGLAHAYAAARRGLRVVVFERNPRATGASVRNFGLLWPIGQPHGAMYKLALQSQALWLDVLRDARLPYSPDGSLHAVYRDDEAAVAREFAEIGPGLGYRCAWLDHDAALSRSAALQPAGLIGALWSPTEIAVDPRLTLRVLPEYLRERLGVDVRFGCAVRRIDLPLIEAGTERWMVDSVIVCSGEDFETLYPEDYSRAGLTRVKLQMLRTGPQPDAWRLGPALAAGLTLRFYSSFQVCGTLAALKKRILEETPEYERLGIHGLVSQTAAGELTLGDSHEYGLSVNIFNREEIDCLILRYISTFLRAPDLAVAERWYGVYAKHLEKPYLSLEPCAGVRIVTSPGGAGMTLSFGVAAKTIQEMGNMKRVQAVIFDWAGTTVDHGSMAPVKAVTELFARHGIPLSDGDARRDMGLFKKDHIRRILERETKRPPAESDVEALFAEFVPLQMEILAAHSQLIAGASGIAERLRGRGIKLGSTTGYTRPMLDVVRACAAAQGYRPDAALCPDDTGGGRPHPWMCLRIALDFRLDATAAAIKVGDTASDIEEGLNAGMWTVGVSATGNEAGRSAADWQALPAEERQRILRQAEGKLIAAGAHYVIENVSQLEPVLEQIEGRMAAGTRP